MINVAVLFTTYMVYLIQKKLRPRMFPTFYLSPLGYMSCSANMLDGLSRRANRKLNFGEKIPNFNESIITTNITWTPTRVPYKKSVYIIILQKLLSWLPIKYYSPVREKHLKQFSCAEWGVWPLQSLHRYSGGATLC